MTFNPTVLSTMSQTCKRYVPVIKLIFRLVSNEILFCGTFAKRNRNKSRMFAKTEKSILLNFVFYSIVTVTVREQNNLIL
jgi:hypothetical protein